METTFVKSVSFFGMTVDPTKMTEDNPGGVIKGPVTKSITFVELDEYSREQHKYVGKLIAWFTNSEKKEGFGSNEGKIVLDTDDMYDLVVEFLKKYSKLDDNFTAMDREELLNDYPAIWSLSDWLVAEKFFPFFQKLMPRLKPATTT